jgi:hypothetical protein
MLKKALDRFGSDVVKRSESELSKQGKDASKRLSKSLDYNVKVSKNSFELSFVMEDYGKFVDKGVKGIGGSKADGTAWKRKKVTNNLYSYKEGIQNKPSRKHFDKWVLRRGIAGRSANGQFMTRIGLTTAISHSVWHRGLETTNFFTKPFEKEFKQLPDDLVEAYGLEVDEFLKFTIQ